MVLDVFELCNGNKFYLGIIKDVFQDKIYITETDSFAIDDVCISEADLAKMRITYVYDVPYVLDKFGGITIGFKLSKSNNSGGLLFVHGAMQSKDGDNRRINFMYSDSTLVTDNTLILLLSDKEFRYEFYKYIYVVYKYERIMSLYEIMMR